MAKKIVKRKKLKLGNFLIVLLILTVLVFFVYYLLQEPIKNIIIKNTNYLNDDYIINLAGIKNYPSFFLTSSGKIKNKLLKSDYIEKVTIKKEPGFILELNIEESRPLFYNSNNNKYVLSNKKEIASETINNSFRVPRLINYVPDNKYNKFLLYMDDDNMVYLTLTKFKMINHYNEVLAQLDNHKGILYLDSGNHFKIME